MSKIKLYSTILLSLALLSFQKTPDKHEPSKKNLLTALKSDTLVKKVILDDNYNEFLKEGSLIMPRNEQGDLFFSFSLKKPRLFSFYSIDIQTIPQDVYITPGDTLTFKLGENQSIVFEGKNSAHYNFIPKLRALGFNYPNNIEKNGIIEYKKNCEKIYEKRKAFLEQYIKNENVSVSFIEKMRDVLRFEYFSYLSNRFILPKREVINYPEYLKEMNITMFNRDDMLDFFPFKNALLNYLFYASMINKGYEDYSKERLIKQVDLINKKLSGTVKDYVIAKTVEDYYKHITPEIIAPLKSTIETCIPNMTVKFYADGLGYALKRLDRVNLPLPDKAKNSKVMDLDGNTFTLEEVLKQQGKKAKIIDFWASWCGPCIQAIRESHQYREELSQNDSVKFLYFSVDKDPQKWKQKVTELKTYGMNKNQYLIDESTKSYLEDIFSVYSIPNYVILDHEDKLFLVNAPSPTDKLSLEKEINKLKDLE